MKGPRGYTESADLARAHSWFSEQLRVKDSNSRARRTGSRQNVKVDFARKPWPGPSVGGEGRAPLPLARATPNGSGQMKHDSDTRGSLALEAHPPRREGAGGLRLEGPPEALLGRGQGHPGPEPPP